MKFLPWDDEDLKKLDKLIMMEPPPDLDRRARWRWKNKLDPDRNKDKGQKK